MRDDDITGPTPAPTPPRHPNRSAQVCIRDVADPDGSRFTAVATYCPGCDTWSPVLGGERMSNATSAAKGRRAGRRGEDASTTPIAAIMTRHVVCVRPDLAVEALTEIMLDQGLGGVPVLDEADHLLGIVTKSDILRGGWEPEAWLETAARDRIKRGYHVEAIPRAVAGEIMTPFVFTLPTDAPVSRAAALMAFEDIHWLAVVADDDTLVGVVSSLDVMRWVAQRAGYVLSDERAGGAVDITVPPATGRVMIVDDDAALLADYEEVLGDEGYSVIAAKNGAEALDRLREAPAPALIMMDLAMPVMDGWSLRAELARNPLTACIPVVLLSGKGDLVHEVARLGVDGFLTKPVPLRRLLTTVEQYCKA